MTLIDREAVNNSSISYRESPGITPAALGELFRSSGIKRPVDDETRLAMMLKHANLIFGAFDGDRLVGVARALTDFSYCCYLSDLAVAREYQKLGIGRTLIEHVKRRIGNRSMLLLLSSPDAMTYYPTVGLEPVTNGWIIKRVS